MKRTLCSALILLLFPLLMTAQFHQAGYNTLLLGLPYDSIHKKYSIKKEGGSLYTFVHGVMLDLKFNNDPKRTLKTISSVDKQAKIVDTKLPIIGMDKGLLKILLKDKMVSLDKGTDYDYYYYYYPTIMAKRQFTSSCIFTFDDDEKLVDISVSMH